MKRLRSLLDVVGAIDGLVDKRPLIPPESESNSESESECNSQSSCPAEAPTFVARSSVDLVDSQRSVESAFSTEMGFFSREEDSAADMYVFLSRAVSTARTPAALRALVEHLLCHGAAATLQSLKRTGQRPELIGHLCAAAGLSAEHSRLLLRVVVFVVRHSDAAALCEETVVRALLRSCRPIVLCPAGAADAQKEVPNVKTHWSQRKRGPPGPSPPPLDLSELTTKVNELCGADDDTAMESLALRALLDIVFAQNGNAALPTDKGVVLVFADAGGFETVTALLQHAGEVRADALHLLEAVTLCVDLRKGHGPQLRDTASSLVGLIVGASRAAGSDKDEQAAALRVLTNVTGLLPAAMESGPESTALARWAGAAIADTAERPDTLAFALCCATNIVKWEGREGRSEFTDALVASVPEFLARVADRTFDAYHKGDTEMNVLAGYYALLLAVISLCVSPGIEFRVPVMTAVANATKGTTEGKKAETRPMTLIVAILQEFLLFQSSAGSLTRDTLIEMSEIIDRVVKQNNIEVSTEA